MSAIEDTPPRAMSNFTSRILVAIVGLPVVLGILWLGGWWLFGLVAVTAFIGIHEFVIAAKELRPLAPAVYLGVLLALIGAESGQVEWLLGGFVATFVLAFILNAAAETRASTTAAVGSTVLGSAWIGLGLGSLLVLRQMDTHGRLIAFTVVIAVFAADSAAYLFGRVAGRHLLAPRLSPKKTWEGLGAGVLAGIFATFVALYDTRRTYLTVAQSLVLGAAIVAAAVVGDLFESAVKRDLDVKDTGRLLGGHGGVLDRIDALVFAAPAAYFILRAFDFH